MKAKQERRELKKLYDLIPTFKCIEGCTDCCGPVMATREEMKKGPQLKVVADRIESLVNDKVLSWCATCPYARPGHGCAIYEDRPFICRLFGTTEDPMLTCTHGYGSEKKFTIAQSTALTNRYLNLIKDDPEAVAIMERLNVAFHKKAEQEQWNACDLPRKAFSSQPLADQNRRDGQ